MSTALGVREGVRGQGQSESCDLVRVCVADRFGEFLVDGHGSLTPVFRDGTIEVDGAFGLPVVNQVADCEFGDFADAQTGLQHEMERERPWLAERVEGVRESGDLYVGECPEHGRVIKVARPRSIRSSRLPDHGRDVEWIFRTALLALADPCHVPGPRGPPTPAGTAQRPVRAF